VNRLYNKSKLESCALKTKGRISGTLGGVLDEDLLSDIPLNYSFSNVGS
jgi:hypothetical protein